MRKNILIITIPLLILIISLIVRSAILGGGKSVTLADAPANSGIVAMNIVATGGNINIPQAGSDFNLTNINYFDNDNWIVAKITPTKSSSITTGIVILQKQDGIYKVMVGPGTAFDNSLLVTLPTDVGKYLSDNGYIYEFTYQ